MSPLSNRETLFPSLSFIECKRSKWKGKIIIMKHFPWRAKNVKVVWKVMMLYENNLTLYPSHLLSKYFIFSTPPSQKFKWVFHSKILDNFFYYSYNHGDFFLCKLDQLFMIVMRVFNISNFQSLFIYLLVSSHVCSFYCYPPSTRREMMFTKERII